MKIMKLVRKIAEENGPEAFALINQLILENDPLIESALDIFMEDEDEVELRDTLKRLVEKKRSKTPSALKTETQDFKTGVEHAKKEVKAPGSHQENEKKAEKNKGVKDTKKTGINEKSIKKADAKQKAEEPRVSNPVEKSVQDNSKRLQ
jgi:hypothetical protein